MPQNPRQCLTFLLPTRSAQRGLTLIEIVVVVLVIGIAMAMAIPNLFVSDEERVRQESERLVAVLEQTRDNAVFSGHAIAVRLTEEGLEFLERDPDAVAATWKKTDGVGLTPRAWRDGVRAAFMRGEKKNEATDSVVFVPAGVSAPFEMIVFSERNDALKRVIVGDPLGNVGLKR